MHREIFIRHSAEPMNDLRVDPNAARWVLTSIKDRATYRWYTNIQRDPPRRSERERERLFPSMLVQCHSNTNTSTTTNIEQLTNFHFTSNSTITTGTWRWKETSHKDFLSEQGWLSFLVIVWWYPKFREIPHCQVIMEVWKHKNEWTQVR